MTCWLCFIANSNNSNSWCLLPNKQSAKWQTINVRQNKDPAYKQNKHIFCTCISETPQRLLNQANWNIILPQQNPSYYEVTSSVAPSNSNFTSSASPSTSTSDSGALSILRVTSEDLLIMLCWDAWVVWTVWIVRTGIPASSNAFFFNVVLIWELKVKLPQFCVLISISLSHNYERTRWNTFPLLLWIYLSQVKAKENVKFICP
jgi:hypothetical protein